MAITYSSNEIDSLGCRLAERRILELRNVIDISCSIKENDKTPYTDGYIAINGYRVDVQVKSHIRKKSKSNNLPVLIKYLDHIKKNKLLFLHIYNVSADNVNDCKLYYRFIDCDNDSTLLEENESEKLLQFKLSI